MLATKESNELDLWRGNVLEKNSILQHIEAGKIKAKKKISIALMKYIF